MGPVQGNAHKYKDNILTQSNTLYNAQTHNQAPGAPEVPFGANHNVLQTLAAPPIWAAAN